MKTTMNVTAMEMRNLYHRYMAEGFAASGLLHIIIIAGLTFSLTQDPNSTVKIIACGFPTNPNNVFFENLIINTPRVPRIHISQSSFGIPIPVPDPIIIDEPIDEGITQTNGINGTENGVIDGTDVPGSGDGTLIEVETAPKDFIPGVEKYPVIISNPSPKYPEIARRSGIEGTVFIKIWVTKEGKVKQAEIVKSTSKIFDQNAIEAALLWKFTPAIMNNGPVSVWVTVPFKFRLN